MRQDDPHAKSSNRRSISRRKFANGRNSVGADGFCSSFFTTNFVAASAMSYLHFYKFDPNNLAQSPNHRALAYSLMRINRAARRDRPHHARD
jgi:hypothetical protein